MTDAEQLKEDQKILDRIDSFGAGLSTGEISLLESFMKRVKDEERPLSEKQRKIALEIDDRRVR